MLSVVLVFRLHRQSRRCTEALYCFSVTVSAEAICKMRSWIDMQIHIVPAMDYIPQLTSVYDLLNSRSMHSISTAKGLPWTQPSTKSTRETNFASCLRSLAILPITAAVNHHHHHPRVSERRKSRRASGPLYSVTVFSLWLWLLTRTAERPDKQLSLQSAPKTVDSRQRRDRRWQ